MEDFLTIHELSTQFDVSARVIRYNFHKLRAAGQLTEGPDYKRAHYIDETHFEWRIAPLPFMRASGLTLAPVAAQPFPTASGNKPVSPVVNQPLAFGNQPDNHPSAPVTQTGNEPAAVANHASAPATKPVTHVDTKTATPSLEREVIDLLKSELTVKNGQIADLSLLNEKLNDLNKNLVGRTVALSERIEELLTLPAASQTTPPKTIKVDEPPVTTVNHADNQASADGEPTGDTLVTQPASVVTNDHPAPTPTTHTAHGDGGELVA